MRIEVLLDLKTRLGESPVWDVEQQRLWWVDSLDGRLFACNAQGGAIKSWDVRQKIGSFALRQSGEGAVVALQVFALEFETTISEIALENGARPVPTDEADAIFAGFGGANDRPAADLLGITTTISVPDSTAQVQSETKLQE